jgi:hypothetical protein
MVLAVVVAMLGAIGATTIGGPRFYPDDPLWIDDDGALDASSVVAVEDANSYDFVVNTFSAPGERRNVRAMNVNTLDEVPIRVGSSTVWAARRCRLSMSYVDPTVWSPSRSMDGLCPAERPLGCSQDFA